MGRLLEIARTYEKDASPQIRPATAARPMARVRLSDFATSGRVVRLWSDVLGQEVCFAADNADPARLPPGVPVYYARELTALWGEDGRISPEYLRRIHEVKKAFDGEIE